MHFDCKVRIDAVCDVLTSVPLCNPWIRAPHSKISNWVICRGVMGSELASLFLDFSKIKREENPRTRCEVHRLIGYSWQWRWLFDSRIVPACWYSPKDIISSEPWRVGTNGRSSGS